MASHNLLEGYIFRDHQDRTFARHMDAQIRAMSQMIGGATAGGLARLENVGRTTRPAHPKPNKVLLLL